MITALLVAWHRGRNEHTSRLTLLVGMNHLPTFTYYAPPATLTQRVNKGRHMTIGLPPARLWMLLSVLPRVLV